MYFKKDALTELDKIPAGSKIHIVGVCGVAMAQLALELVRRGYAVSGSDKEYYEPMGSLLKNSAVRCFTGYSAENIKPDYNLVVIGNAVTKDNPEVIAAEQNHLSYTIFPKLLYDLAIKNRCSIVVAGTHGKTTTSAMLSYLLEQLGQRPSYFFGGKAIQIENGLKVSNGRCSVAEGDEYDSAFFVKHAKFHFYKPDILIISSIEFDHADIYQNLEQILQEFLTLIAAMPAASSIVANSDDQGVRELISRLERNDIRLVTFAESANSDVNLEYVRQQDGSSLVRFVDLENIPCEIALKIPGKFNLKNAVACYLALRLAGVEKTQQMLEVFNSFLGVARRQQVWLENPVKLIEDFAHHPTAVKQTLTALREWNPGRRIIAIFEPRSVTSRRKLFENDYAQALSAADIVILKKVEARILDKAEDLLDVETVCRTVESSYGKHAVACAEIEDILKVATEKVKANDLLVVMSNGSFGGLIAKLRQILSSI